MPAALNRRKLELRMAKSKRNRLIVAEAMNLRAALDNSGAVEVAEKILNSRRLDEHEKTVASGKPVRRVVRFKSGLTSQSVIAALRALPPLGETVLTNEPKSVAVKPRKSTPVVKLPKIPWTELTGAAFYASREWQTLRYAILAKYDGHCQACGRSRRQHEVVLHVDHIKPISRFPHLKLDPDNLQLLCQDCNLGKSAWDQTDWRPD